MEPEFQITRTFTSSLDAVDQLVTEVLAILDARYSEYNRFALDLVLRETLNNAVIHGNKQQPELKVTFSLSIRENIIRVCVEDEGDGFDWHSIIRSNSIPEDEHGRGFPILANYCYALQLNEHGNQIRYKLKLMKTSDPSLS